MLENDTNGGGPLQEDNYGPLTAAKLDVARRPPRRCRLLRFRDRAATYPESDSLADATLPP